MKKLVKESLYEELNSSEALFAFGGMLTSLDKPITIGSSHDAAIIAELIDEFIKKYNLPEVRDDWDKELSEGLKQKLTKGLITLSLLSSLSFANAQSKKIQQDSTKYSDTMIKSIKQSDLFDIVEAIGYAAIPKEEAYKLTKKYGKQKTMDYLYKEVLSDSWKNVLITLGKKYGNDINILDSKKISLEKDDKKTNEKYLYFKVKYKVKIKPEIKNKQDYFYKQKKEEK